jgi:cytochrome c556
MLRVLATVATVAVGATTVAYAQNLDIIKQRRQTMRAIAGASTPNFKMTKGDVPFDLAAVQANLKTIQENAEKLRTLFPDDSRTGGETDASPKIWTARADFNATIDKWIADTKAVAAKITDEASFKANYPAYGGGCGGCHKATDGFSPSLSDSFKKPKPS